MQVPICTYPSTTEKEIFFLTEKCTMKMIQIKSLFCKWGVWSSATKLGTHSQMFGRKRKLSDHSHSWQKKLCCRLVPLNHSSQQLTVLTVTSQGTSFQVCYTHFLTLSEKLTCSEKEFCKVEFGILQNNIKVTRVMKNRLKRFPLAK